jgi:putative ABC transport system ATP-binding protein
MAEGVAAAQPMIRLTDLRFRYPDGDFELVIPDLRVELAERVAVIGPSGSGKTTLLHLIAGIASPDSGALFTAGTDLPSLDDRARRDFRIQRIGLVFQEFELLDYLSVLDNILLPYRINPILRLGSGERERARALADRVGIADKLARRPDQLSQGERQRAAVCRALVVEPELLLADEPTGNLDPGNKDRVLEILIEYAQESGATLLTVTHDEGVLKRFQRVIDFRDFLGVCGDTQSSTGRTGR